jgi:hypothetical protein
MKTPPARLEAVPPPPSGRAAEMRARFRLACLLGPVLLKILGLHFFCRQGVSRLVVRTPGLRRRPCYWRSQLIQDLLPRFGFATQLHLGARPEHAGVATHLWVTWRGVPLDNEPPGQPGYVELAVYPPEATND